MKGTVHRPPSRLGALALTGAVLVCAGCSASRPLERFHTLLPMGGSSTAQGPASASRVPIDLMPVSVPAQVDQAQWVVRQADDSLLVLEQERWAAPLRDELRAAIADRLVERWTAMDVRGVAAPASPAWRIRIDVQRFESIPGASAQLEATWSLSSPQPGGTSLVCRSRWVEPVARSDAIALAAAHRRAVVRLADEMGQRLQLLRDGKPAPC